MVYNEAKQGKGPFPEKKEGEKSMHPTVRKLWNIFSAVLVALVVLLAVALVGEIPGEEVPAAVDAAQACPVSAIRMEES